MVTRTFSAQVPDCFGFLVGGCTIASTQGLPQSSFSMHSLAGAEIEKEGAKELVFKFSY